MAKHRLVWFSNRSTPKVVTQGQRVKKKKGYGKVVRSRPANASEERTIAKGGWVRVDHKGRKPSNKNYKVTSYRKGLAKKRRAALRRRKK